MRDSMVQQKRHAPLNLYRKKKLKLQKGLSKGEYQGRFEHVILEGQARSLQAD